MTRSRPRTTLPLLLLTLTLALVSAATVTTAPTPTTAASTASSGSGAAATPTTATTTKTTKPPSISTSISNATSASSSATSTTITSASTSNSPTDGPIVVRGNKLYNAKTGARFFIKGLTYEYAVSDAYYDQFSKAAIAQHLDGLAFNALRVYNINPDESYAHFMTDMAKRGVYVLVAASPDSDAYFGKYRYAPIRKDLAPNGKDGTCYPALLLEYGKKIALNFAQYDNSLGIILANEIMQKDLTAGACVKQYAADLKAWMRANANKMRVLPLAYAAADSSYNVGGTEVQADEYHVVKLQGLLCGDTVKDGVMQKSIDIYLINEYRWCVDSDYDATYKRFYQMAEGLPIVIALGEFGCVQPPAKVRTWDMVPYLFQSPADTQGFSNVFSGGLAYSYGQAKLDATARFPMFTGGSLSPLEKPSDTPTDDYTNLKAQYAKYNPSDDKAGWSGSSDKCKWAPSISEQVSVTNKRASDNGWIINNCGSSNLKLASTDTWETKTREGAACDDEGNPCKVKVTDSVGTTQASICGGKIASASSKDDGSSELDTEVGGGSCKVASDCGHGQCVAVNGSSGANSTALECKCNACYIGTDCSKRDPRGCATLNSSKTAPIIVFSGLGVFLVTALAVFIGMAVVAHQKKTAHDKIAEQVKLGGNVQEGQAL